MANSSPPTRAQQRDAHPISNRLSYPWGSGIEFDLEELRIEDRNTEESHQRGLAQAKRDHGDLRKTAIEVLKHYHLQEEQRRIKIEQAQQEARLRAEAEIAAERQRLEALKAKKVALPPPPPPEPEPARSKVEESAKTAAAPPLTNGHTAEKTPAKTPALSSAATQETKQAGPSSVPESAKPTTPASAALNSSVQPGVATAFNGNERKIPQAQPPLANLATSTATSQPPTVQVNGVSVVPAKTVPPPEPQVAKPDRHVEIHKKLKQLRAFMEQQRQLNPQLKSKMGDMRREIRKSMGQLIEGTLASNKQPVLKITGNLRDALQGTVPSQPVDPNEFLLEPRNPIEAAQNNNPQLPSLFIYLLNIFAKAAIAQFINECGAKPQAADPVGTVVAKIFSDPEFQWRGGSMIDLLLAKYRVVCPVLFGFRGNDRTEQGRLRVGWWKAQGGGWIPEQIHVDRMTGLGAGFGAIALRDFSRSKNTNPYPPSMYWAALARIVNTPANEISDTQCYVLKAMIEYYEQKFIHFYGSAAVAALRLALVEFPAKVPKKSAAVGALPVLAQILKRDTGLSLE